MYVQKTNCPCISGKIEMRSKANGKVKPAMKNRTRLNVPKEE